jgi:hypothetical protein
MKILFASLGFAGLVLALELPARAGVILGIDSSTGSSTEQVTSGVAFTLNIEVSDTSGTQALGGFDLTFQTMPSGVTFEGYNSSSLVSGFVENENSGLTYSASANGMSHDLTIGSSGQTLVTANFIATMSGTVDFVVENGGDQELSDGSGVEFSYTDEANTIVVATPEPPTAAIILAAMTAFLGRAWWKRFRTAQPA